MKNRRLPLFGIICGAALGIAAPAPAQEAAPVAAGVPAALPDLHFTPNADAESNFDKYYFFHRADTDYATAYADLQECDGYARGLSVRVGGGQIPYPYAGTLTGAVGGLIADIMVDMISGSAERRRLRRINMRTCMAFKGYTAFGLPKAIWEQFNFEEGNARIPEDRRQLLLQLQARAASGPRPTVGEIRE